LSAEAVANAEYVAPAPAEGVVRLENGEYHQPAAPGATSETSVSLVPDLRADGDLNGDGSPDAAVILAGSGGGSGTFISLAALPNNGGQPGQGVTTLLGDRVQVRSLSIDSGRITVNLLSHAPTDPMCCPTLDTTRIFRLQGNALVEETPPG
jgi:hypothetical protein